MPSADEPRAVPPLMTATWDAALSDSDPLLALGATRALAPLLANWEARLVAEATEGGATWEMVGTTVGVSRQAAWERFHGSSKEFRHQVKHDLQELRDRHRKEMLEMRERIKSDAEVVGRGRKRKQ